MQGLKPKNEYSSDTVVEIDIIDDSVDVVDDDETWIAGKDTAAADVSAVTCAGV